MGRVIFAGFVGFRTRRVAPIRGLGLVGRFLELLCFSLLQPFVEREGEDKERERQEGQEEAAKGEHGCVSLGGKMVNWESEIRS